MKPDDVPQWAWDAAEEPSIEAFEASVDLYETGMETANVQLIVARAIIQARSEAFEECAKIADGYAVEPDPDEQDPYDEWEMGNRSAAKRISQAIRQHSQKGRVE